MALPVQQQRRRPLQAVQPQRAAADQPMKRSRLARWRGAADHAKQAIGRLQYPIGDGEHWQQIVDNLAVVKPTFRRSVRRA